MSTLMGNSMRVYTKCVRVRFKTLLLAFSCVASVSSAEPDGEVLQAQAEFCQDNGGSFEGGSCAFPMTNDFELVRLDTEATPTATFDNSISFWAGHFFGATAEKLRDLIE